MSEATIPTAPVANPNHDTEQRESKGFRISTWMLAPAVCLLLFVVVFPTIMQVYISLTDWGPGSGVNWTEAYRSFIWFENFGEGFTDSKFGAATGRTLLMTAIVVPIEFLLGLTVALAFVEKFPGKTVVYALYLIPMMAVPAVTGYMFLLLLQGEGPVNHALRSFLGPEYVIPWLSDPTWAFVSVLVADIWQWTPLMFIILLAGILGVSQEQIRAAKILGAGYIPRLRYIIFPQIRTVVIICIGLRIIESLKLFDVMYIMTRGGPGVATETLSVYIYKLVFSDLRWGYVASLSLIVTIALTALAVAVQRKQRTALRSS